MLSVIATDYIHDCKIWWEVMDRTIGDAVNAEFWDVDKTRHTVTVKHTLPFHEYTVSFLVFALWDPTQMYNHITNDWGDKPHEIPFDVRQPASGGRCRRRRQRIDKERTTMWGLGFQALLVLYTLWDQMASAKNLLWIPADIPVLPAQCHLLVRGCLLGRMVP